VIGGRQGAKRVDIEDLERTNLGVFRLVGWQLAKNPVK
jgi:hypothetical protein